MTRRERREWEMDALKHFLGVGASPARAREPSTHAPALAVVQDRPRQDAEAGSVDDPPRDLAPAILPASPGPDSVPGLETLRYPASAVRGSRIVPRAAE